MPWDLLYSHWIRIRKHICWDGHLQHLCSNHTYSVKAFAYFPTALQELELRIETQKQTLAARDESIKKLMEMLQSSKGVGSQLLDEQRIENERLRGRLIEAEARTRHLESMLENLKRDQDRGDLGKNRQVSINTLFRFLCMQSYTTIWWLIQLHQIRVKWLQR